MDFARTQAAAIGWIDANRQRFSDFNRQIWHYAEPAWREYKSAKAYVDLLRADGWDVEEASGDMPTAFAARWGSGAPVLGGFAEYDAVPGNSQQIVPYQAPREGLHPWAAGHTDPHSQLGTTALVGMLATKAAMQANGISGTLKFFGEPAEKVCGSKPVHAAKGYFDGCDAFIACHPHTTNSVCGETQCGAYWSAVITFETLAPETWIDKSLLPIRTSSHATARCPGAIDALCLMYTTTKYTKEAMYPHSGAWTLNEFILVGGDATSDNLPPRFSQIQYSWRSPSLAVQQQIEQVLRNNARHAAALCGCQASLRWVTKTRIGLPNTKLTEITWRNMQRVGAPAFGDEARDFARAIQRNLGIAPMDNPFIDDNEQLLSPEALEARQRTSLPPGQFHIGADDYVEYTWHAPTVRLFNMRPTLRAPDDSYEYPAWTRNALGGLPAAIDPGLFMGAKTIACTFLDLLANPAELAAARSEFQSRTGGGVRGAKWVAPLLPREFGPPVDLRWPEYVTTARGTEWCIPTPHTGSGGGETL
ncbi:MAG TPA: M20/M25/M40 family metallo-hydrolase [Acetobacteraceae bacterium]